MEILELREELAEARVAGKLPSEVERLQARDGGAAQGGASTR